MAGHATGHPRYPGIETGDALPISSMITRFLVPFFHGVCLDPRIGASSRVLPYVLRMFA
ncbi:hypothetical protein DSCA_58670 [Desulfosarcina alkanivorans]|jgi:hypothetical protein|uniref:Uncharacterized protein n=1 Tax=Desulfosarcina alkanivorans TaxID=571177 RepID=A0A5K7Z5T1_9BACT|nr:hypothetical protein DSCA_58670 [Desulfosarcina alkanivorans]